jgi:hypothetical protein
MPGPILDAYERGAANEAMNAAGSYCFELNKFDIRYLTDQELSEFTRRFVVTYENTLRERIMSGEAPF